MSRPGIELVTSRSPKQTLYQLSYRGLLCTYKVEKLQRRASKLNLGNDYTTLENARKQLHVLSFEETMFIHKVKIMYKIAYNVAPIYLTDLFPMRGNANKNNTKLNMR